ITSAKTAHGAPMEALRGHEGEIAVRAWRRDPQPDTSHVAWILGTTWVPYQLPTFVTPSFAGYVSGHSTFSRAAAEVLAGITGSAFFPGGMGHLTVNGGALNFERGPSGEVDLQLTA